MTAKLAPYNRLRLIKRALRGEPVASICREAKISRTLFYRWLKRYEKEKGKVLSLVPKGKIYADWKSKETLSPKERLLLIDKVRNGEKVEKVCRDFGVSRTLFYKWYERYNEAPEGRKLEALWDKKPHVEKYFNQAPEEYEQAVLSAVEKYPELSSHKLIWVLPRVGNKPILSNHGVYNVLRRHNLTSYEARLLYAKEHQNVGLSRSIRPFESFLSFILRQIPSVRTFSIRAGFAFALALFVAVAIWGGTSFISLLRSSPNASPGIIFSFLALVFGIFFFIYSLKYYLTMAIVLSFSRRIEEEKEQSPNFFSGVFGFYKKVRRNKKDGEAVVGPGLYPDASGIRLERKPFISVHVALYNELRVVERLLTALTSFNYENYEVIVADDSIDETRSLLKRWAGHPRVKISHRETREGFKGGALKQALTLIDPRTEFVVVFDSDFIPYPDSLTQFLKYFKISTGSLSPEVYKKSNIASVQGYQWHVLNKSENWVTRGVRSEYSGSYVLERSAIEIYGGLKQIAGSVYMIRRDVLEELGWGTSITEDFELTLRLYEKGYKVVYTPYVQAPAEAVSTIKRAIRQRMRWAEGHSFNVKKMFTRLIFNKNLSFAEKIEFIYVSPYYLQAFFFIAGTFCWFLGEAVFAARLPFWTAVWGWSLVFTNMLALPLMNMVGLFLEEAEEKDYLGLFSFMVLSYVLAPFQAYASVKGLLERQEGPWFRTPKTGRITDTFTPGRFYRYIRGMFGDKSQATPSYSSVSNISPYLALSTANNSFSNFRIGRRREKRLGRLIIVIMLIFSLAIYAMAIQVPTIQAAANQLFLLSTVSGTDANYPNVSTSKEFNATANASPTTTSVTCTKYGTAGAGTTEMFYPTGSSCGATSTTESAGGYGWFFSAQSGQYPAGSWSFTVTLDSATTGSTAGTYMLFAHVYSYNGSTYTSQFYTVYNSSSQNCSTTRPARTNGTAITASKTATDYSWTCTNAPLVDLGTNQYLYVQYFIEINGASSSSNASVALLHNGNSANNGDSSITTTTFGVPEGALFILPVVPLVPKLVESLPIWFGRISSKYKWLKRKKQ